MERRSFQGFTLVELTIVTAVAAILTALAVPCVKEALARRHLRNAAHALRDDLDRARLAAISATMPVQVAPSPGARGWAGGWSARHDSLPLRSVGHAPLHESLRASPAARPFVRFGMDGATPTNQTLTLCTQGGRHALNVIVDRAGRSIVAPANVTEAKTCSR